MELRPYREGDEGAILALFREAFGRELPADVWRWRFVENPAGPGILELAWQGRQLVAHCAVTPVAMELEGRSILAGLSGTVMTHPGYRGPGLFALLANRSYQRLRELDHALVWGFPNANSHPMHIRGLQWVDVHEIPTFRLLLSEQRPRAAFRSTVEEVAAFDERFDGLWERVRGRCRLIAVRDRRQLEWRYGRCPGGAYRILTSTAAGSLMGYLVFKRYRSELQVIDLLCEEGEAWPSDLIGRLIDEAREADCASVGMWCGLSDPLHLTLEMMGFRNAEPVTYFGSKALADPVSRVIADYRNWFLSMGDSDVY